MPQVVSTRVLHVPLEEWVKKGLGIIEDLAKQGEYHSRVVFNGDRVELTLQKFEWSEEEKAQIAAEAAKAAVPAPVPEKKSQSSPTPVLDRLKAAEKERAVPKYKRKER